MKKKNILATLISLILICGVISDTSTSYANSPTTCSLEENTDIEYIPHG